MTTPAPRKSTTAAGQDDLMPALLVFAAFVLVCAYTLQAEFSWLLLAAELALIIQPVRRAVGTVRSWRQP